MVYQVEIGGPAHIYARDIPAGAMSVGVVHNDDGMPGGLLRVRSGAYAQMHDHAAPALGRLKVLRAMAAALERP